MKKTKKKKTKQEIIKRREFILNFISYFGLFSVVAVLLISAILEDKDYELNTGLISVLTLIYGAFIIWLMYYLSIKWGATKGGYFAPNCITYGLSTNITVKKGKVKESNVIINSFDELLKYFDSSKYNKQNIEFKNYNIELYYKDVYRCINSYLIIKADKDLMRNLKMIKAKYSSTILECTKKSNPMSYNLMIIIYLNDNKRYSEYKDFMTNLEMIEFDGLDEIIIPAIVNNSKFQCLDYISGPMAMNYDLCIRELDKFLK